MARASQTTQQITRAGRTPTLTAPSVDGDIIDAGPTILYVFNGSGASIDVTVASPVTVDGLDVEDLVVAVPASGIKLIGPFPVRTFGQPSGSADVGRVYVSYSAQSSVTRGVFSL